jgi:hypothetical protein
VGCSLRRSYRSVVLGEAEVPANIIKLKKVVLPRAVRFDDRPRLALFRYTVAVAVAIGGTAASHRVPPVAGPFCAIASAKFHLRAARRQEASHAGRQVEIVAAR